VLYILKGEISSTTTKVQHPSGWCKTSHIVPERPQHTSLLVERGQSDEANQYMGMIRRPWWTDANGQIWPGCQDYTPTLFPNDILGFLMTTESQVLCLMSRPNDGALWQYSLPPHHYTVVLGPTQTTGWAPPTGHTNTYSISNLVFSGGLPSRYWPGSALLSFSGQPVLGYRVWLLALLELNVQWVALKSMLGVIQNRLMRI